jgi:hypothetical protein
MKSLLSELLLALNRGKKNKNKNRKRENGKGVTYRIVVRGGWVGGEDDGEHGDEEEGEHGRDEDPVREEAP